MASQRLADDAKAAHVELCVRGERIDSRMRQPAISAEHRHQGAASRVGVRVVDTCQVVVRPGLEPHRQVAVAVFEERPVEVAPVRHQLPPKTGFAFAAKAW